MNIEVQTGTSTRQPLTPFLSDKEVAGILRMTREWVRNNAREIPGFLRIGAKYRFARRSVERWLGSLEPLLLAEELAALVQTTPKWIYGNAETLVGFLRLGRYVRFRPTEVRRYLDGDNTEVVQ